MHWKKKISRCPEVRHGHNKHAKPLRVSSSDRHHIEWKGWAWQGRAVTVYGWWMHPCKSFSLSEELVCKLIICRFTNFTFRLIFSCPNELHRAKSHRLVEPPGSCWLSSWLGRSEVRCNEACDLKTARLYFTWDQRRAISSLAGLKPFFLSFPPLSFSQVFERVFLVERGSINCCLLWFCVSLTEFSNSICP